MQRAYKATGKAQLAVDWRQLSMEMFAPSYAMELREPRPEQPRSPRLRHKQVARIICHLRDDLHGSHPQLNMPTRWMIECLVANGYREAHEEWQAIVIETLKNVRNLASANLHSNQGFTRLDGKTPLFPNDQLFDEWDAFRFCQTLLQYLGSL
ncbi:MAG: hypothetical protein WDZ30_09255 [Cellvibrionaceae bacterium]